MRGRRSWPAASGVIVVTLAFACGSGGGSGHDTGSDAGSDAQMSGDDSPTSMPDVVVPPVGDAGIVPVMSIASGLFFTCILAPGGIVKCWGYNAYGMLGDGNTADSTTAMQVSNVSGAPSMVATGYNACALLGNETVSCWGDNFGGQLGQLSLANSDVPVAVPDVSNAIQVSLGTDYGCALRNNGTAVCWGSNNTGQLGQGNVGGTPYYMEPPRPVLNLTGAVAISAGGQQTCALMKDHTVQCWGDNMFGELGTGAMGSPSPVPVPVPGLTDVVQVSSGGFGVCALRGDSTVWCWGGNGYGELGNGAITKGSATPAPVKGLSGVASISAGEQCACAALSNGTGVCWGYDDLGQLGDGTMTTTATPVPIAKLTSIKAIAAGNDHSCAQLTDGTFACWGNNQHGQLGDGTTTSSLTAVTVKM